MTENPFDNTENAFSLKSDGELKKSHFIFSMMGQPWLVNLGSRATMLGLKYNLPIKGLVRSTIFDQFCGGIDDEECMPLVEKMFEKGVSSILDYSVEGKENESDFDAVVGKKLSLIHAASGHNALPFEVVKPTGIGRFYIWQKITEGDFDDLSAALIQAKADSDKDDLIFIGGSIFTVAELIP